jgi:uncharacterized NAD-dependent epimerase/dehydratase family protein
VVQDHEPRGAVVLCGGRFSTTDGKTAHGLVRGPSRWPIVGVVDPQCAGADAGELLDGQPRGIPVRPSIADFLVGDGPKPAICIIGVATEGGVLPPLLRGELLEAAEAGMTLVNGLHQLLADDEEFAAACDRNGARMIDIRRPRPFSELRFWTGEALDLEVPRVAVLGTDCALGKRTTAMFLRAGLRERGLGAELVYTGQTGWLQGIQHGFILDATPNDFVPGELERAVLACAREAKPDVILIEGQAALRHPSGPCGSELILSAGASTVVLQHAPGRKFFDGYEERKPPIPPLAEEIELIRLLGARVCCVTLNDEGLEKEELERECRLLEGELGLPVLRPLAGEQSLLARIVAEAVER